MLTRFRLSILVLAVLVACEAFPQAARADAVEADGSSYWIMYAAYGFPTRDKMLSAYLSLPAEVQAHAIMLPVTARANCTFTDPFLLVYPSTVQRGRRYAVVSLSRIFEYLRDTDPDVAITLATTRDDVPWLKVFWKEDPCPVNQ